MEYLEANKTTVVIVAMPILENYKVDPELTKIIKQNGMLLLDCRQVPGITTNLFVDSMHLGKAGSKIFSHYLADRLSVEQKNVFGYTVAVNQ